MSDIVERLDEPEAHYPGNFDTPKRANAMLSCLCQEAKDEIETLRQQLADCREAIQGLSHTANEKQRQLAEKDAEIERLKTESRDACIGLNDYFGQQLAASQARELQLREALDTIRWNWNDDDPEACAKCNAAMEILALPADTSALEAMIAKAGEVMRGRALARPHPPYADYLADGFIRALPSVTLEDLQ